MKKGFTLIEILISVTILATVMVLISQVLFTSTHVNTKSVLLQDIKQNGEYSLDVISRSVRGARAWYRNCADGQTSTDSAMILTNDNETITYMCVSDGAAARIASVSATGNKRYLTNNTMTLSAGNGIDCSDSTLTFSCPSAPDDAMTISFTLSQRSTSTSVYDIAKQTFETSVKPRSL